MIQKCFKWAQTGLKRPSNEVQMAQNRVKKGQNGVKMGQKGFKWSTDNNFRQGQKVFLGGLLIDH